ncbi:MAG: thioredoxin family protein [Bacteroidales bacterium]
MRKIALLFSMVLISSTLMAQGYSVGDVATDFRLLNVDGKYVSMADFPEAKGFVVIFSCNHCPYVVAYEDRMIDLHNKYAPKGFPVIAINPNDTIAQPADSYTKMIERANEKGFPFVYLFDDGQKIYPQYGATRTPHVYLLEKTGDDLKVAYIGAIDDNYRDADQVTEPFLANAIDALLEGKKPDPDFTRAIGCTIKTQ